MQICGETKRAYGTKLWGELRMAFFKFVIECIFALFDAVVGNPGLSPEAVQKTAATGAGSQHAPTGLPFLWNVRFLSAGAHPAQHPPA